LITNVGAAAGQEIHHFHWHIVAGESLPGFGGNE
jgi:diadenosine tetraphosphate (Ap4A) HIT family hydrolase